MESEALPKTRKRIEYIEHIEYIEQIENIDTLDTLNTWITVITHSLALHGGLERLLKTVPWWQLSDNPKIKLLVNKRLVSEMFLFQLNPSVSWIWIALLESSTLELE